MLGIKMFASLLLLSLAGSAFAQDANGCIGSPLECSVCGRQGANPLRCYAFNATFDDLTVGQPVGQYEACSWPGFTVDSPLPTPGTPIASTIAKDIPHINPSSPRNYALASSGTAVLQGFTYLDSTGDSPGFANMGYFVNTALLNSFDYACSTPGGLKVPLACTLNITAVCPTYAAGQIGSVTYSNLFSYAPAGVLDGDMHHVSFLSQGTFPANDGSNFVPQGQCNNFTFVATRPNSDGPVALELDNVVFAVYFLTSNL